MWSFPPLKISPQLYSVSSVTMELSRGDDIQTFVWHYDGEMVYCENNREIALSFKNLLERVVDPGNENSARLCTIDSNKKE